MPVAPTLNLFCNIWTQYATAAGPPVIPPSFVNVQCNLQFARKTHALGGAAGFAAVSEMFLLVPKLTDLRTSLFSPPGTLDIVECPAGSKRWYAVIFVDDQAKGFPTETRVAILTHADAIAQSGALWSWTPPYP